MGEEPNSRGRLGNVCGSVAAVIVMLYLVFPSAFVVPILLFYGHPSKVPRSVSDILERAFYPQKLLVEHVPPYAWLVQKQGEYVIEWFWK